MGSVAGAAAFFAGAAAAQDVDLSGIVADQAGRPVDGAVVRLVTAHLRDTTGAAGAFELRRSTVSVVAPTAGILGSSWLAGGSTLMFTVTDGSAPTRIDLFDMQGKLVAHVAQALLSPGTYAVDPLASVSNSRPYQCPGTPAGFTTVMPLTGIPGSMRLPRRS